MDQEQVAIQVPAGSSPDRGQVALSHLDELPTLPAVAVRLIEVCADPNIALEELCDTLRGDPTLVARILTAANSAANTSVNPIETLERAIVRLGLQQVRGFALAAQVFDCFNLSDNASESVAPSFVPAAFWEHSLAVASAAELLAEKFDSQVVEPGTAFVAGLLHDIGKIALAAVYPKTYERVAARAQGTHGDIADSERDLLGLDHTLAGRRLAQRWKLPAHLVDAIWLHHLAPNALPSDRRASRLIAIVQAADLMAREQHIGYSGNFVLLNRSEQLTESLGLPPATHHEIVSRLGNAVRHWAQQLNLHGETTPETYQHALRKANQELGRLHTRALETARQHSTIVRYFESLTMLDTELGSTTDVPAMLRAMSVALRRALQTPVVVAFIVRPRERLLEAGVRVGASDIVRSVPINGAPRLARWWADPGEALTSVVMDAPQVFREDLPEVLETLGTARQWLMPLAREGRVFGGLIYSRDRDERLHQATVDELSSIRPLLSSLTAQVQRTLMYADAQRLSDELADSNRRLQMMQNEMLRTRTLASIAEIAAGAGHEMNNPLSVISGRAQMLRPKLGDALQRDIALIIDKAHECSQVVRELMDFAQPKPLLFEMIDLGILVQEACDHWRQKQNANADRMQIQIAPDTPVVAVDAEQIKIVLSELLRNADAATQQTQACIDVSVMPGELGWVALRVRDRGVGMSHDVLERAFDPFFSHHVAGRRRGLGLSRAQRIVQGHGGRIWIESRPGHGATVHVLLPIRRASDLV